jgi:hypothetical protein
LQSRINEYKSVSKSSFCKTWSIVESLSDEHGYFNPDSNSCATFANLSNALSAEKQTCSAKYNSRMFLPESKMRLPPALYTFPGSGNTWCRLLIEFATGYYSGSLYSDHSLQSILPGERACGQRTSIVKVHPNDITVDILKGQGVIIPQTNKHICKKGAINFFDRVIFLVRDPFFSIWSEYQRQVTNRHHGAIPFITFDRVHWEQVAIQLAYNYKDMWITEYSKIANSFAEKSLLVINRPSSMYLL